MIQNVVFMGTPDFAVGTLEALIQSKYQVQAVFSQPDRPKGRGKALVPTPVKAAAQKAGIPVYQPEKIREPWCLEELKKLQPDVVVVVAFGQMIPRGILELPPYGCINVHASLLPKYRGAAPIQWAVLEGEEESGVTTMRMDAGLDTGDMILRETVPLSPEETGGSLFLKLSEVGASLLLRTLAALEEGTAAFEKQPEESPTPYASMLTKEQGRVDFRRPAREIERQIRGLDPWPGTFTLCRGKTLKLWKARVLDTPPAPGNRQDAEQCGTGMPGGPLPEAEEAGGPLPEAAKPGEVLPSGRHELLVQTGQGILSLLEVQPEGKKRMSADAYLRGYPLPPGEILG